MLKKGEKPLLPKRVTYHLVADSWQLSLTFILNIQAQAYNHIVQKLKPKM